MPMLRLRLRSMSLLGAAVLLFAAAAPMTAHANEQDDWDAFVEQAATVCPHYSGKTGEAALRAVKIETVRTLASRNVLACTDTSLTEKAPVIWYGRIKTIAWNPDVAGSTDTAKRMLDQMATDDSFPGDLKVWNAKGEPVEHTVVPMFNPNCPSATTASPGCPL